MATRSKTRKRTAPRKKTTTRRKHPKWEPMWYRRMCAQARHAQAVAEFWFGLAIKIGIAIFALYVVGSVFVW